MEFSGGYTELEMKDECSPYIQQQTSNPLCLTKEDEKNIKEATKKSVKENMASSGCDHGSCLIKAIKDKIDLSKNVKPAGPRNSTEWLSNFNVDDVLKQWTEVYPKFYHMTYQMIDFQTTNSKLAQLDLVKISDEYDSLGVVFNTDKSTGLGQHWFAIYCDFKKSPYTLEYFNSSGGSILPEIEAWMIETIKNFKAAGKEAKMVQVTDIVNQKDTHSCGVYSVYYIIKRLEGTPYTEYQDSPIPNELMWEWRKKIFRITE